MAANNRNWRSEWQRQQQAMAREAERQRKAAERAQAAFEKEQRRRYLEQRQREVDAKNEKLQAELASLATILRAGLGRSARVDLGALRRQPHVPPLDLGPLRAPVQPADWTAFAPRTPGALSRLFGGSSRYERELAAAKQAFQQECDRSAHAETSRREQVAAARAKYEKHVVEVQRATKCHNNEIEVLIRNFKARHKAAVEEYLQRVLTAVPLPAGFPHQAEVTYSPRSEQAVVRFELPPRDVVPAISGYKYLSTKDEERTAARAPKDLGQRYRDVVSQVALLCTHDLFNGDSLLKVVGFNGHVHATNPATGAREYPCIVSLNVDRADFPKDANLRQVTPEACVRHLKAIVSNHPYELEPIQPILDFDLSKYSFVEGFDAVSTLDSRPDLLEMSYTNFEHLVRQIFEAQGAEGWTTEQSNDDGVDAVIAKRTSLVGGLSIVQAKRWSKVVGISHVRELAGAIEEKKAGWGILVTTSWFTQKCWEKAREHGRMELIDGERLVYLIKEHLGKDVVIGIPNRPRSTQSDA